LFRDLFHGRFCPSSLSAHPRIHHTISQSTGSPICPLSSLSARPKQPTTTAESATIPSPCLTFPRFSRPAKLGAVQGLGLFLVAQSCEKCDRMTQLIWSRFSMAVRLGEVPAPSRLPTGCPADPRPKPKRRRQEGNGPAGFASRTPPSPSAVARLKKAQHHARTPSTMRSHPAPRPPPDAEGISWSGPCLSWQALIAHSMPTNPAAGRYTSGPITARISMHNDHRMR
jgi:hypothetical protein